MRPHTLLHCTVGALLLMLLANFSWSEDATMQTGWLELVKGSRDSTVGAQLVNIEEDDNSDTQKITLAIPKKSLVNRDQIEEVLVVGKQPEKPDVSIPIKFTYEWVNDYDSENYGLVIRLGKDTNWPIRLYMNSAPGFTQ